VVIVVFVVMAATLARFFQFVAPLLRLTAMFAVPGDGLAQIFFCIVDSLFAFPVAIAVAIMITVLCLGHTEAAKSKAPRENCRYDSLFTNHSTSLW
jgi:hypothetical protein